MDDDDSIHRWSILYRKKKNIIEQTNPWTSILPINEFPSLCADDPEGIENFVAGQLNFIF